MQRDTADDRSTIGASFFDHIKEQHLSKRDQLRFAYNKLLKDGLKNISYVFGECLIVDDREATIDGSHPSDLGMMRMAEKLHKELKPLLQN